jgi:hypothetical protein
MRVRIEATARDDLVEAYRFYEDRQEGLGDYFLACLYSDIESLKIFGGIHRKEYRSLHRALSQKFPFAIYYVVERDGVVVKAVLDCRREPSWIRKRLQSR